MAFLFGISWRPGSGIVASSIKVPGIESAKHQKFTESMRQKKELQGVKGNVSKFGKCGYDFLCQLYVCWHVLS